LLSRVQAAPVRPEMELLLSAARALRTPADAAEIPSESRPDLDWPFLLHTAHIHGLTPLLYRSIGDVGNLAERFRDNMRRNFVLVGELIRLLERFAAQGIRALPLKGLTLAQLAYQDLALRECCDIDLLLAPGELPRAAQLLRADGYEPLFDLPPELEATHLRSIGQLPFVRGNGASLVELHAEVTPHDFGFPLDFERLWPRRISIALLGREVPSLCPEDTLLILCAHGAKHVWNSLRLVADVAHLIHRSPEMDWPQVQTEARRTGSERMLALGLILAETLLDMPLPETIAPLVRRDRTAQRLAEEVSRRLLVPAPAPLRGAASAWFHFRVRERRRDGLRYSLSTALLPTLADWRAVHLPARLSFLYAAFRPLRLGAKYASALFTKA
jgi:Uncharacterised nucleotidyltransferase